MDLRHLRYFMAVAEERSFSGAARRLHVAQPALSRQIRALETELGAPLFQRTNAGAAVSAAGAVLLAPARALFELLAAAVRRGRLADQGELGTCEIATGSTVLADRTVVDMVEFLRTRAPELRLVLHEISAPAQWAAVRDGRVQIALGPPPPAGDSTLASETISVDQVACAAVASTHRLATAGEVDAGALIGETLHMPPRAAMGWIWPEVEARLSALAGRSPTVAEHDSWAAVWAAVAAGRGWVPIPAALAKLPLWGTVGLRIRGLSVPLRVAVTWRQTDRSPVIRTVRAALAEMHGRAPVRRRRPIPAVFRPTDELGVPHGMELRQLRYFAAVAEHGSLGRAARQLRMTAPALSRQIRGLEREVGFPLFDRDSRGVVPTAAARVLLEDANGAAQRILEFPRIARRAAGAEDARLTLGTMAPAISRGIVGHALELMARREPRCVVTVKELPTPEQLALVAQERLDVGIAHAFPGVTEDPRLSSLWILADVIDSALVSERHPLAAQPEVLPEELAELPFLFLARPFHPVFYDAVMQAFAAIGLVPRIHAAFDGLPTVWAMVAHGAGWGLTWRSQSSEPPPGTVVVPIRGMGLPLGVQVVWRTSDRRPAVRALVACIREAALATRVVPVPAAARAQRGGRSSRRRSPAPQSRGR